MDDPVVKPEYSYYLPRQGVMAELQAGTLLGPASGPKEAHSTNSTDNPLNNTYLKILRIW